MKDKIFEVAQMYHKTAEVQGFPVKFLLIIVLHHFQRPLDEFGDVHHDLLGVGSSFTNQTMLEAYGLTGVIYPGRCAAAGNHLLEVGVILVRLAGRGMEQPLGKVAQVDHKAVEVQGLPVEGRLIVILHRPIRARPMRCIQVMPLYAWYGFFIFCHTIL